jgi:hypothetical protein
MDVKTTGRRQVTLLGAAMLVVCLVAPQLRAQPDVSGTAAGDLPTETVSINFGKAPLGLARGQTARFTVVNPAADRQGCGEAGTGCAALGVSIVVSLLDQHGALITRSAEVGIPPGEFRSIDFDRDALPVPGDPGSGRLQTRPVVRLTLVRTALQSVEAPALLDSIEIVDNLTGETTVLIPAMLLPAVQKVWVAK